MSISPDYSPPLFGMLALYSGIACITFVFLNGPILQFLQRRAPTFFYRPYSTSFRIYALSLVAFPVIYCIWLAFYSLGVEIGAYIPMTTIEYSAIKSPPFYFGMFWGGFVLYYGRGSLPRKDPSYLLTALLFTGLSVGVWLVSASIADAIMSLFKI